MYIYFDPDEWVSVVDGTSCTACRGDLNKCHGACNGSFIVGRRRLTPDELAVVKALKDRQREEAILAEAEAIRARRAVTDNA